MHRIRPRPHSRNPSAWALAGWTLGTAAAWAVLRLGPTLGLDAFAARIEPAFDVWYAAPILVPVALLAIEIRRRFGLHSSLGRSLVLILLGLCSWSLGNVIWFWYATCSSWPIAGCSPHAAVPFPSLADVAFLGLYPFLAVSGIAMGHVLGVHWRRGVRRSIGLLGGLLAVSLLLGLPSDRLWGLPLGWGLWVAPGGGALETVLSIAYLVGDVLLLWMVAVLLGHARGRVGGVARGPLLLLAAGALFLYLGDITFFQELVGGSEGSATGFSNTMYALGLPVATWGVYGFTRIDHRDVLDLVGRSDATHEVADALVASQVRVLGPLAWEVAEAVPGVVVRDGQLHLAHPREDALRALARAYRSRTGRFGGALARQALEAVAARREDAPSAAQVLDPGRTDRAVGASLEGRVPVGVLATVVAVAVGVDVLGDRIVPHSTLVGPVTYDQLPGVVAIAALATGLVALHRRLLQRGSELERANETLGRLLDAVQDTRRQERVGVAGEIHDFALQPLIAALMHLERTPQDGVPPPHERGRELIQESVRELRRIMDGLEPSALLHRDLGSALTTLSSQVEGTYQIEVGMEADDLPALQLGQQLLVYRAVSELLTNAGKHSGASRALVRISERHSVLHATVADDGRGFAHDTVLDDELPEIGGGWGLRLLFEQVLQQGGHFRLQSVPAGGTRVDLTMPLARPA